jgi:hypothetical protein
MLKLHQVRGFSCASNISVKWNVWTKRRWCVTAWKQIWVRDMVCYYHSMTIQYHIIFDYLSCSREVCIGFWIFSLCVEAHEFIFCRVWCAWVFFVVISFQRGLSSASDLWQFFYLRTGRFIIGGTSCWNIMLLAMIVNGWFCLRLFLLLHLHVVTFIHSQSPLGFDKSGELHQMFWS